MSTITSICSCKRRRAKGSRPALMLCVRNATTFVSAKSWPNYFTSLSFRPQPPCLLIPLYTPQNITIAFVPPSRESKVPSILTSSLVSRTSTSSLSYKGPSPATTCERSLNASLGTRTRIQTNICSPLIRSWIVSHAPVNINIFLLSTYSTVYYSGIRSVRFVIPSTGILSSSSTYCNPNIAAGVKALTLRRCSKIPKQP